MAKLNILCIRFEMKGKKKKKNTQQTNETHVDRVIPELLPWPKKKTAT